MCFFGLPETYHSIENTSEVVYRLLEHGVERENVKNRISASP